MTRKQEFVGIVYDYIEEVVIDRSPVIRSTFEEAMADAKALVKAVNGMAEQRDDEADGNTTIGRVDDDYAYVQGPYGIESEDDKADREYDEHQDREELRVMGRLPGQDDTPSLPAPYPY